MVPASDSAAGRVTDATQAVSKDCERRVSLRVAWAIWIGASMIAWSGVLLLAHVLFG